MTQKEPELGQTEQQKLEHRADTADAAVTPAPHCSNVACVNVR